MGVLCISRQEPRCLGRPQSGEASRRGIHRRGRLGRGPQYTGLKLLVLCRAHGGGPGFAGVAGPVFKKPSNGKRYRRGLQ